MTDDTEREPIDVVSEEVLEQIRVGKQPQLEEYIAKYPQLENDLRNFSQRCC